MGAIEDLTGYAQRYAATFPYAGMPSRPTRKVAILTCMDTRIDPAEILGIRPGDAHVLRNAGGALTADARRSLTISQRLLGTEEIALIRHTACGVIGLDTTLLDHLQTETGHRPDWPVHGFEDLESDLATDLTTLRADPFLPHTTRIRGFIYDAVHTGTLTEVLAAPTPHQQAA